MVYYDKRAVVAFKEYQHFNQPWSVEIIRYPTPVVTPPHYGNTIEILLYDNIEGTANINGHIIPLGGKQVVYIAPNIIHGMNYNASNGSTTVIKLDPKLLSNFVNIQALLYNRNRHSLETLPIVIDDHDQFVELAAILADADLDIMTKLTAVITMFKILADDPKHNDNSIPIQESMPGIDRIISWTEKNYAQSISLDDVAAIAGYSKNYFCNKFKTATGVTYNTYLNHIRIYHACHLLEAGVPIQNVCTKCGFENVSYFVQLFKKTMGITPKKYSSTTKHTD